MVPFDENIECLPMHSIWLQILFTLDLVNDFTVVLDYESGVHGCIKEHFNADSDPAFHVDVYLDPDSSVNQSLKPGPDLHQDTVSELIVILQNNADPETRN